MAVGIISRSWCGAWAGPEPQPTGHVATGDPVHLSAQHFRPQPLLPPLLRPQGGKARGLPWRALNSPALVATVKCVQPDPLQPGMSTDAG